MADRPNRAPRSATPGKLILIGVLAAVLLAVLYVQYGRPGQPPSGTTRKPARAQAAGADRAKAAGAEAQNDTGAAEVDAAPGPVDATAWKRPDVAAVIAYDPFALPSRFPQPRLQRQEPTPGPKTAEQAADAAARSLQEINRELEQMRQLGVKVILNEQDQYVALIGDQTIRVGDEINGFTVTEITPSGVRVERKIEQ